MMASPSTLQRLHALRRNVRWRKVTASLRDTWLLFRQFEWPLFVFLVAILGGGAIYYMLAQLAGESVKNLLEAIYIVLSLTFLQSASGFPGAWYLEIFYFIMPVIGVIILAQGVTEFGVMLFNRRARDKEWEMAVASTLSNHVILIGLGHLGYRVARNLYDIGQDVVIIERNPTAHLVASAKELGISVIQDDASREAALEAAGVRRARSIVLCTQNDSLNLQVALKARRLKPDIQVVVRIFDDDFAQSLQEQFSYTALSATGMAAPVFAAAAAGLEMTRPITVEGEIMSLGRLKIAIGSRLDKLTVGDIEQRYNLSVVLLRRNNESDLHPSAELELIAGDTLAVLGGPAEISLISQENLPASNSVS
jgi:voltage-gated potassium channel